MTDVYVCRIDGKTNLIPILGPLRSYHHGVQYIEMLPKEKQGDYCNASRYHLQKVKLYPLNKTGNAKLVADLKCPGLAELFQQALGRAGFFSGFPEDKVAAARKVLDEYQQKTPLV